MTRTQHYPYIRSIISICSQNQAYETMRYVQNNKSKPHLSVKSGTCG